MHREKVFSTRRLVIVQEIGISIILASISARYLFPRDILSTLFCINKIIKIVYRIEDFFGWILPLIRTWKCLFVTQSNAIVVHRQTAVQSTHDSVPGFSEF